jgi:hypothetical protein
MAKQLSEDGLLAQIVRAILDFISRIPDTDEALSADPDERARAVGRSASRTAALISGSLALPPGPLGWLTILPDLVAIWRIQAQMIADIAGVYGKSAVLNRVEHPCVSCRVSPGAWGFASHSAR